ncbi:MAG: hypothetical protein BZ135_07180 [Methanosphaera sp. rholeuAM6]|nr:MAG: hypothetical protein BZ135_07180 [Methanosphaera sp. rholeuAM6]
MNVNILDTLERGSVFEVLVATENSGGCVNIKPFGVIYDGENFVLNLFSNESLLNVKDTGKLTIYFTDDALLFTRALIANLTADELTGSVACGVCCEVTVIGSSSVEDSIGKNTTSKIIAKPIKIKEYNKALPIINRATNHIIELLVDLSRYQYMNVHARNKFIEKILESEKTIRKTGNKKHEKAIKLIKKEINMKE